MGPRDLNYELILIVAGSFTALTGALGAIVAALCWFLRHLLVKTIPDVTRVFGEQMAAERADNWELHRLTMARIDRAEANIMGYPFVIQAQSETHPDHENGRTAIGGGS